MKTERCSLYAINILHAIRMCVVGNEKNEEVFLENEGIYLLFEFLEECIEFHHKQLLSLICALLENPNSLRYFEDWTSSVSSKNSSQLLIQLYMKQDDKFGVGYEKGVLTNKTKPLNPRKEKPFSSKGFVNLKLALKEQHKNNVEDLMYNLNAEQFNFHAFLVLFLKNYVNTYDLRNQIYCVMKKTGFKREGLSLGEQQRMEIIKNFREIRAGELWIEIQEKFKKIKVQVTEDDKNFMQNQIEEMQVLLQNCLDNQLFLDDKRTQNQ